MSTTQVLYDGKRIIPASRLEYSRTFNQLPNGDIVGQTYNINFTSKIVAYKGSPDSLGNFWVFNDYPSDETITSDARLSSILKKQEALRELFNKENIGKKFEVIPEDLGNPIWFYPESIEITFSEGPWFDTCDYSIAMTTSKIYPNIDGIDFDIVTASEAWTIEPNEQSLGFDTPFTYRVSHSLSATGKKTYVNGSGNNPFLEAKSWISSRTGIQNSLFSGFNNLDGLGAYNHILTENIDESNASYSVNETWLFASGNVIDEYNVSSQAGLDGITQVSIQGSIQGLDSRTLDNISGYKWENASGYFNSIQNDLLNRAQNTSNISLNPSPVSYNIGRNPLGGTISYAYEYDNRISSLISGALSERIVVGYNDQSQKIAIVPVIGRSRGPVLQQLGTSDPTSKSLSIDFILGKPSGSISYDFPYSLISGLVDQLDPINNGATKSFKEQPQKTWEPLTQSASYNITWIYE